MDTETVLVCRWGRHRRRVRENYQDRYLAISPIGTRHWLHSCSRKKPLSRKFFALRKRFINKNVASDTKLCISQICMLHSALIPVNTSNVMGTEHHADVFTRRHCRPDTIPFDPCVATLACRKCTRIARRSGTEVFARLDEKIQMQRVPNQQKQPRDREQNSERDHGDWPSL